MQKVSEPTFAKLLQDAVNQGQVVLVPAPSRPPSQRRIAPVPATPPLRDRDEASLVAACCLLFKLRHSESRILVALMMHDYRTKEELRLAASHDDQTIAIGTMAVFISSLRKKLAPHSIRISTLPTLGYGLDGKARAKIHKLLAEHDAGIMPTCPRPEPKVAHPDLFEPEACTS